MLYHLSFRIELLGVGLNIIFAVETSTCCCLFQYLKDGEGGWKLNFICTFFTVFQISCRDNSSNLLVGFGGSDGLERYELVVVFPLWSKILGSMPLIVFYAVYS